MWEIFHVRLFSKFIGVHSLEGAIHRSFLGVNNVFDKNPPFSNQANLGNWQSGYNNQFSDPTGRAFYMRLKYEFL